MRTIILYHPNGFITYEITEGSIEEGDLPGTITFIAGEKKITTSCRFRIEEDLHQGKEA